MMWSNSYGWDYICRFGNTICMALIMVILIAVVVYEVVRQTKDGCVDNGTRNRKNSALDILDRRLANGEISEEEYKKRKKVLEE